MNRAELLALFAFTGPFGARDKSGSTHQAITDAAVTFGTLLLEHAVGDEQAAALASLAGTVQQIHTAVAQAHGAVETLRQGANVVPSTGDAAPVRAIGEELPEASDRETIQ